MVTKSGLMVLTMKERGKMACRLARVNTIIEMVMFTKVNGKITKLMDMASTNMQMAQSMKESGLKIIKKVLDVKSGQTPATTVGLTINLLNKVMVTITGRMVILTWGTGTKIQ